MGSDWGRGGLARGRGDVRWLIDNAAQTLSWARREGLGRVLEEHDLSPRRRWASARGTGVPWSRSGAPGGAVAIFVTGVPRSGTNMVARGLGASPGVELHNEGDRAAFRRYRLRSSATLREIVNRSRNRVVVFKPLLDSHAVDGLLQSLAPMRPKVIWVYRDVDATVRSHLRRFGHDAYDALSALSAGEPGNSWHGEGLSPDSLALVRAVKWDTATPADAAALLWYVRHRLVFERGLAGAPNVLVLSYDAMVREPERIGPALCDFAGVEWDARAWVHVDKRSVRERGAVKLDAAIRARCVELTGELDRAAAVARPGVAEDGGVGADSIAERRPAPRRPSRAGRRRAPAGRIRVASVIKRLHVGGDETRLLTLARLLDREAFEHVVVVVNPSDDERDARIGAMLQRYRDAGVEVVVLGEELLASSRPSLDDAARALAVLRRLTAILRDRRIDVVDARLEFGTVYGLVAGRLAGVPVAVATGYSPAYWRSVVRYPLGQLAFAGLDAFVSDSVTTLEDYRRWRLTQHARLVLIPNGVMPALPTRARADVRASLDLPVDVPVVAQVARMIPRKGCETFIAAARIVADHAPDVAFLLCGFAEDPAYRDQLRALASSVSLRDRMTITSYPGPIGDVMGAVDVFAHLSTFDSSPIAVHEAMSAALPAVVSSVGGTPELVVDGVTGLVVPAADPDAAGAALLQLLADPDLARRLGDAARSRYDEHHRPESMARAHERLYRELLLERGVRA
jgi:glycosyltransferase involved in cell wall biosynthesis